MRAGTMQSALRLELAMQGGWSCFVAAHLRSHVTYLRVKHALTFFVTASHCPDSMALVCVDMYQYTKAFQPMLPDGLVRQTSRLDPSSLLLGYSPVCLRRIRRQGRLHL